MRNMKLILVLLILGSTAGCATVDGVRTDVGNGIEWVADQVKPDPKEGE